MAIALLVNAQDIVKITPVKGNVDTDYYLQNIVFKQDTSLEDIIGIDLLDKLKSDVLNDSLTGDYLELNTNYIKPFLVYAAASDYILTASYSVDNGGLSTYTPSNGSPLSDSQVLRLTTAVENKSEHYGQTLIKYLKKNKALFPEYVESKTNSNFNGWQLDSYEGC